MTKESPAIVAFKSWVFPGLVSLMGMMIWNGVNEIKNDIKFLTNQSVSDHTRIDNLERVVYGKTVTDLSTIPQMPPSKLPPSSDIVAMIPDNRPLTRSTAKKK